MEAVPIARPCTVCTASSRPVLRYRSWPIFNQIALDLIGITYPWQQAQARRPWPKRRGRRRWRSACTWLLLKGKKLTRCGLEAEGKREETRTQKPGGRREIARKFFNLQGLLKGTFGFPIVNRQKNAPRSSQGRKIRHAFASYRNEYW